MFVYPHGIHAYHTMLCLIPFEMVCVIPGEVPDAVRGLTADIYSCSANLPVFQRVYDGSVDHNHCDLVDI